MVNKINQPATNGTFGKVINVQEFMDRNCGVPVPMITAMDKPEFGELTLLGFDVQESIYDGSGKIEVDAYGPKMIVKGKSIREKNVHKVFGGDIMIEKRKVTVTEFGNDAQEYEVTAAVTNKNKAIFTTVSGLMENDSVLIVKTKKNSNAVQSKVKITSVDTATKEITFDANITMDKGDVIRYINSTQGGCMDNTKRISEFGTNAKSFDYYTQFFAREVEIENEEFDKYFRVGSQQYEIFTSKFWIQPANEIFRQVANQLRHGAGTPWATSEIKGYNTVIEEREAAGLTSIVDFNGVNTANDLQTKLEDILFKVNQAPVDSKFIMITNQVFYESYRNMLRKLYSDAEARACCNLVDTLHHGMMKWEIQDAPMIDVYLSHSLSKENRHSWVAYILPVDLIAGFVPNVSEVSMSEGANSKLNVKAATPNMFGTIMTREKTDKKFAECSVYEHYTRLGFFYAWVSFRDTYYRLDNFNFNNRA